LNSQIDGPLTRIGLQIGGYPPLRLMYKRRIIDFALNQMSRVRVILMV
jgi:hypothetical protein